jgi:hypothetical protein
MSEEAIQVRSHGVRPLIERTRSQQLRFMSG